MRQFSGKKQKDGGLFGPFDDVRTKFEKPCSCFLWRQAFEACFEGREDLGCGELMKEHGLTAAQGSPRGAFSTGRAVIRLRRPLHSVWVLCHPSRMTELEKHVRSGIAGVRTYLEAKMTADAVVAAERLMESAHEIGREHPLYVEAARAASLAYAYDRNPGMAARYMHQAVAAADRQASYPKDRRGMLHLECARAALEGSDMAEASLELDQAITLLKTSRETSDAEARGAMLLRIALCEATGDIRSEVLPQLQQLRDWLAPVYTNPESKPEEKAIADHDLVSALCVTARLLASKQQFDMAVSLVGEAYTRAENYRLTLGREHPFLLGLVNEAHKDVRRFCRGESAEVRAKVDVLHTQAEHAEALFWQGLRQTLGEAQGREGLSDAAIAALLEPSLHSGELSAKWASSPSLLAHLEVLVRHSVTGSFLREVGAEVLRHVERGDKTLADGLSAMQAASLLDV